MQLVPHSDAVWKQLRSDSVVVMRVQSGVYYTLNETASRIWLAVTEGKDEAAIVSTLLETYEGSQEEITEDVREQLDFLVGEDLLCEAGSQPGKREAADG